MTIDIAAPVQRFALGDRVSWDCGDKNPRIGTIVWMSDDDATYCHSGDPADLYAPWGTYFGRSVRVECDDHKCFCNTTDWKHHCNECQFAAADQLAVQLEGMLF